LPALSNGFSVLPPPATCPTIARQLLCSNFLAPDGSFTLHGMTCVKDQIVVRSSMVRACMHEWQQIENNDLLLFTHINLNTYLVVPLSVLWLMTMA
jgi:hypothetical protein